MLSKCFMQFSAGLTNISLAVVVTSNCTNYSFCFTIRVTDDCVFLIPSDFLYIYKWFLEYLDKFYTMVGWEGGRGVYTRNAL